MILPVGMQGVAVGHPADPVADPLDLAPMDLAARHPERPARGDAGGRRCSPDPSTP